MRKQEKNELKIFSVLKEHFRKNIKEYSTVAIVFLIGIIIGIVFINNTNPEQKSNINDYISSFSKNLNEDYRIDNISLLKESIKNNLLLALAMWFIGSTVIGIPILYLIVAIRGFALGFTISSIMVTFSLWKAILFTLITLFIQNIIFIPTLFSIAVSGIKLYKSIVKEHSKENIKLEILRHTIFSTIIAGLFIVSSFIEAYISSNLLTLSIKFFV